MEFDLPLFLSPANLLATIFCFTFSAPGFAQTDPESGTNAYLAPMTVLADHPQCQGAHARAFNLTMIAEDLRFRIGGDNWYGTVDLGGDQNRTSVADDDRCSVTYRARYGDYETKVSCGDDAGTSPDQRPILLAPRQCFITERKGTEIMQLPVACDDGRPPIDLNEAMRGVSARLDITAQATMCQTLTSFRVVDGEWTATLQIDDQEYVTTQDILREHPGRCRYASDTVVPRAGMSISLTGTSSVSWPEAHRFSATFPRMMPATYYRMWADRIPFMIDGSDPVPAIAETVAYFYPVAEGQTWCPEGGCALADQIGFFDEDWNACR